MAFFTLTDEKAARWAETRQQGRAWFVLRYGSVWAAIMCAWLVGYTVLTQGVHAAFSPLGLGTSVASAVVGGLIYGPILWWIQERAFAERGGV